MLIFFLDTVTTTTNSTAGEAESRIVFVRPVQGSGQVNVIAGNNQTKFGTVSIPLKIEVIGKQFMSFKNWLGLCKLRQIYLLSGNDNL